MRRPWFPPCGRLFLCLFLIGCLFVDEFFERSAEALKTGSFASGIWSGLPVCELKPLRTARFEIQKVLNLKNVTESSYGLFIKKTLQNLRRSIDKRVFEMPHPNFFFRSNTIFLYASLQPRIFFASSNARQGKR